MPLRFVTALMAPGEDGTDASIYRLIVLFMGVALILSLTTIGVLTLYAREVPPTFGTIAGAIIGSLSTMLVGPSRPQSATTTVDKPKIVVP